MKKILKLSSLVFLFGCASKPILDTDDIKLTRDEPSKSCKSLGPIEGRVSSIKGTLEQAMEALKLEAVKKGADFVKIETVGAQGQTVRGEAYNCN